MSGFENKVTEQIATKLGLQNENRTIGKANEFLRLVQLKSSKATGTAGDYAKTIICLNLAATQLGIDFDYELAFKLSGLRKTVYMNNKRIFEKILDINKPLGVKDICVQLGLQEVSEKSSTLLSTYKSVAGTDDNDIDTSHPQYAAMAVYQACKLLKKKVSKQKLLACSHLKSPQWTILEKQWDKLIKMQPNKTGDIQNSSDINKNKSSTNTLKESSKVNKNTMVSEEYSVWKERMLEIAYAQLKEQEMEIVDMEE